MRYHPRVGFTYMPSSKLRVQGPNGGYLVRTNAAGFRSDREFDDEHDPATYRVMLFGDSQVAGDGTSNSRRFSDLLERDVDGLEIFNYGISGTGTDQQHLAYEEHASVDHDLLVIAPYAENIRRITRWILKSRDVTGEELYRSKPYYELDDGELVLRNVPVPKQAWTEDSLPAELRPHVYVYGEEYSVLGNPSHRNAALVRKLIPAGPLRRLGKAVFTSFKKFQPLPEYDTADTPEWLLFRKIMTTWIAASPAPVLLVPLPHETALRNDSDPGNYLTRFRELAAETGCRVFDPLPDLLELSDEERKTLWSDEYGHFSVEGHEAIARSLAPVLRSFVHEHRRAGRVGIQDL